MEEYKELENKSIIFKCKPTFNFQSIEFEYVGGPDDIDSMIDFYSKVLKKLQEIAPEQPTNVVTKPKTVKNAENHGKKPQVKLASEKQLETLKKHNIKHKKNITSKEAWELIDKAIKEDEEMYSNVEVDTL